MKIPEDIRLKRAYCGNAMCDHCAKEFGFEVGYQPPDLKKGTLLKDWLEQHTEAKS